MTTDMWGENSEEEMYKHILKEFNKTKEDLDKDVNIMSKWVDTQPHFPEKPSYHTVRFILLCNKFSIEKAKQKLDTYYTIRSLMPEIFRSRPLDSELVQFSKVLYIVPLPKVTHDFKRVIYSRINPDYGSEFFEQEKTIELFINMIELIVEEDNCYNFHYIADTAGVELGHVLKFNPMVLKKALIILEKVYSNRIASFYLVNFHPYMEILLNTVVKPMLNPKIRDRLKVYSGSDILLKDFNKSIMPKDIGGEEKSLEELNDILLKKYEEKKERFEVLRTLKVDESLRPEQLVNDDILGYYGNFKKITVD